MRSIEAGPDERGPWIHKSEPSRTGRRAWSACRKVLWPDWLKDRPRKAGEQTTRRWKLARFLLLFALFCVVELLAGMVLARLFEIHETNLPWIQVLNALVVAATASAVLPSMHIVRENRGLAEKEQARFLAAMECSLDDFYIFDGIADETGRIVDFRFSYINPNAERRLGVRRDELIGKPLTWFRPYMTTSGLIEKYQEVVNTGQPLTCEVYIDDERIKETWLSLQVVKLGDGLAITSRDVTASRHMAEHIQRLAHYDQLTGLANRALLQDRLHQAVIRARRYKHKVALLVVDIDHFKSINDSLGHSAGDSLLVAAGQRLLSSIRETDTVARMGGDEFVVVMPDFKSMEDVKRCGAQIVKAASEPIDLGDREIRITASVGVCTFPDYAEDEKQLFRNADAAMYVVKNNGRNGVHVFDESSPTGPAMKIDVTELHSPKTRSGF
ncbi:GGDEF domain-containing protein [Edaphobacter sp. 12200R-103]|jgi:diguanylate cyclase (GGDEF)-like protein|uniref:GGDEF domain-containing protein n=1 Tax=Edaphobacter sp. 12200R-103 TaxID=2703788 RepID=UPI00138C3A19|nr:GGDEF domain-containing protein [Edaphobacter sp. 12200R-103]QHS53230.1 GGDEF domain-containing protein [Edaphobacter sp. 12200R-103]